MAYSKNTIIMQQGQHGAEMYCVIHGEVEVERDGEKLGILGQDSYFGEQQFLAAVLWCGHSRLCTASFIRTAAMQSRMILLSSVAV